jgi:hypothetical protein
MDNWDYAALRATAGRERAKAMHELLAWFAAWWRSAPTISAPHARGRECFGTDC